MPRYSPQQGFGVLGVENPYDKAVSAMSGAANTMARQRPIDSKPSPSMGGAIMSGLGASTVGAQVGNLIAPGVGGGVGAAIGAGFGILGYFLS